MAKYSRKIDILFSRTNEEKDKVQQRAKIGYCGQIQGNSGQRSIDINENGCRTLWNF